MAGHFDEKRTPQGASAFSHNDLIVPEPYCQYLEHTANGTSDRYRSTKSEEGYHNHDQTVLEPDKSGDDQDLDIESSYLDHIREDKQTAGDPDVDFLSDRLNSSDFFDAPEADLYAFGNPQVRSKRLSQEKQRDHPKYHLEEKEMKKRPLTPRERKQIEDTDLDQTDSSSKKKSSNKESKLRMINRSMERDLKTEESFLSNTSHRRLDGDAVFPPTAEYAPKGNSSDLCKTGEKETVDPEKKLTSSLSREKAGGESRFKLITTDRITFHDHVMLALSLGRRSFIQREERERTRPEKIQRQFSEIIAASSARDRLNMDELWLELQAYHRSLEIDACLNEINADRIKAASRLKTDLIDFKFQVDDPESPVDISALLQDPFGLPDDYVDGIEAAVDQASEALDSLNRIESLFPTQKQMRLHYQLLNDTAFKARCQTLNMWLNCARTLIEFLKSTSLNVFMGLDKVHLVRWPFLEVPRIPCSIVGSPCTDSPVPLYTPNSRSGSSLYLPIPKKVAFDTETPMSSPPSRLSSPPRALSPVGFRELLMSASVGSLDLNSSSTSLYRSLVDRNLRKTTFHNFLKKYTPKFINYILKAKYSITKLEIPADQLDKKLHVKDHVMSLLTGEDLVSMDKDYQTCVSWADDSPSLYPQWHELGLPSLIPLYVFCVRIPLDITHECIRLRLEQRIEKPSAPIMRQVVHECSEAARVAITVKQAYLYFLSLLLLGGSETEEALERHLNDFNGDVKDILEMYFGYVENWTTTMQTELSPLNLQNVVEEEWIFAKEICPFITGGMAEAGKRFCGMVSMVFRSIHMHLEQELDNALFGTGSSSFTSVLNSPTSDCESSPSFDGDVDFCTTTHYRQMLIRTCRDIKRLFSEMRERAAKALNIAKMLRKDLEVAAEFRLMAPCNKLLEMLQDHGYVKVVTGHTANYLTLAPQSILSDQHTILSLLDATCGREDVNNDLGSETCSWSGHLLLINTGKDKDTWSGESVHVIPKAETAIALSHITVDSVILIVTHSSLLHKQRIEFQRCALNAVALVNEQTTCHQAIVEAMTDLKTGAFELAEGIQLAVERVENQLDSTDLSSLESVTDRTNIQTLYRETLHQCYSFGFEYLQELNRLAVIGSKVDAAKEEVFLVFAERWMKFVMQKCERGKGTRPRWANQGFDFVSMVIDPKLTRRLDENYFQQLKHSVSEVIKHIIGEAPSSPVNKKTSVSTFRHHSMPGGDIAKAKKRSSSFLTRTAQSEPATPLDKMETRSNSRSSTSTSLSDSAAFSSGLTKSERSQAAIVKLEYMRNEHLRNGRIIGKVCEGHRDSATVRVNVRKVNFKWQRGFKIGEGQFGVVYSAINVDTSELMAMKEVRFQPNDVQTIKGIADELKTFEGIDHPSLVKYYGVELHREEMFIFMEYCDEGTLEEAAMVGLPESSIRTYTRELVIAISVLHEHNIIHRDIKGANIFLVSNGKLKLGDFGCSVKLKEHMTMHGEMVHFVGTAAFMAPEVITQNAKGHGRSADIWSLGCVLIEMVTGRRPWHDLDNSYQIMFKVGMGTTPPVPDSFHPEGQDFLHACFQIEPALRWTAAQLTSHPFVKI